MLIIRAEVPGGTAFGNAYHHAERIANKMNCRVVFNFNGVDVIVGADEHLEPVVERYERDYQRIILNGMEGAGDISYWQAERT